jgi:TRAP-type uncharacterized transport system substrate-binding protein
MANVATSGNGPGRTFGLDEMKAYFIPFWLRLVIVISVVCVVIGGVLAAYRIYMRPTVLTVAVGSLDGETNKIASLLASHIAASNTSSVRIKVIGEKDILAAANEFREGKADLAVIRADTENLPTARTVAQVARAAAVIVTPAGSNYTKFRELTGKTIGVVGADINSSLVAALSNEYDTARLKITFKNIAISEARQAVVSNEVAALLMVLPIARRYIVYIDKLFQNETGLAPNILSIDGAEAIANTERAYNVFIVPQGSLQGSPPVPPDNRITLATNVYLVARDNLDPDLVANLTREIMIAKRDLGIEQPALAQIIAPELDSAAYIPVHPGAAEYYNNTQRDWLDKYANWIFLLPIIFGIGATTFAATWKFLEYENDHFQETLMAANYHLPKKIRSAASETELQQIEDEIDSLLHMHLTHFRSGKESDSNMLVLHAAAQRLDNLIHHQRSRLANNGSL